MTTFIYYFGAVSFSIAITRAVMALVNYLEKRGQRK